MPRASNDKKQHDSETPANGAKWIATSLGAVGDFFGVTREAVANWRRNGMPAATRRYDLSAIVKWRLGRQKLSTDEKELKELAVRNARAKAQRSELELEREQGEYVPYEHLESAVLRMAQSFRVRLEILADSLPPQLEGMDLRERRALITDAVNAILENLADEYGPNDGNTNTGTQAPKVKRGRPRKR